MSNSSVVWVKSLSLVHLLSSIKHFLQNSTTYVERSTTISSNKNDILVQTVTAIVSNFEKDAIKKTVRELLIVNFFTKKLKFPVIKKEKTIINTFVKGKNCNLLMSTTYQKTIFVEAMELPFLQTWDYSLPNEVYCPLSH